LKFKYWFATLWKRVPSASPSSIVICDGEFNVTTLDGSLSEWCLLCFPFSVASFADIFGESQFGTYSTMDVDPRQYDNVVCNISLPTYFSCLPIALWLFSYYFSKVMILVS
jgi:hypothetical protein